ncbi:class I SAM-dependent methyltransferase [Sedimenticola hydrogenitrophicus]|uniref:class I SAM-dependent methyltransferase n=1 Tax=Sedimenticola hydrogenitrophicus TaxID=2967975 RepID=UPI0023B05EB9|nr:class I SAM-dependent methyltransferase [Sedimenticola hydrogenitrophicus]
MRLLYQQDGLPIFQNRMYQTAEEAKNCPKGNIRLVEDAHTGLVFNAEFQSELMIYDKHYQNEQAVSSLFQRHLNKVTRLIDQTIGRDRLVEVGCGKGYFLELLLANGFDVTGFDPTYEGSNPRIQRGYFAPGVMEQAQGLILRHVLEHIENPVSFLEQLKLANGGHGKIYIEVPCFDWICAHRAWFDVFYEHVNYFRLSDFDRMFGHIIDSGRSFGGQYLYVVADLASLRKPQIDVNDRVIFPADFTNTITEPPRIDQNQTAIWGGASKGVIFALLKERAGFPVHTVIDINPAKQGRYLPGTGLRVQSPKAALADLSKDSLIYVMNSNYLEEIIQFTDNAYNYIGVDRE